MSLAARLDFAPLSGPLCKFEFDVHILHSLGSPCESTKPLNQELKQYTINQSTAHDRFSRQTFRSVGFVLRAIRSQLGEIYMPLASEVNKARNKILLTLE